MQVVRTHRFTGVLLGLPKRENFILDVLLGVKVLVKFLFRLVKVITTFRNSFKDFTNLFSRIIKLKSSLPLFIFNVSSDEQVLQSFDPFSPTLSDCTICMDVERIEVWKNGGHHTVVTQTLELHRNSEPSSSPI